MRLKYKIKNLRKKIRHIKKSRTKYTPFKYFQVRTPRKLSFKRLHKGRIHGFMHKANNLKLVHGFYGIKLLKPLKLQAKHIISIRTALMRKRVLKRRYNEKLWLRGFFNTPVTKKPNEIRMGKGKGSIDHWIMRVKPGKIICEVSWMPVTRFAVIANIFQQMLGVPISIVYSNKIPETFLFKFNRLHNAKRNFFKLKS